MRGRLHCLALHMHKDLKRKPRPYFYFSTFPLNLLNQKHNLLGAINPHQSKVCHALIYPLVRLKPWVVVKYFLSYMQLGNQKNVILLPWSNTTYTSGIPGHIHKPSHLQYCCACFKLDTVSFCSFNFSFIV